MLASPPLSPRPPSNHDDCASADARVKHQLHVIESTLADTIHLGEAMLTEFAQQTETLKTAQTHTTGIVHEAREALYVVRAMRSTPYAMWRWCVGLWKWLAGWLVTVVNTDPMPTIGVAQVTSGTMRLSQITVNETPETTQLTTCLPLHVERQLQTLHAQAHALGKELDTHLHLLDQLNVDVAKGEAALEEVTMKTVI